MANGSGPAAAGPHKHPPHIHDPAEPASQHALQSRPVRRRPAGNGRAQEIASSARRSCNQLSRGHLASRCKLHCTLHAAPRKIQLPEPATDFSRTPDQISCTKLAPEWHSSRLPIRDSKIQPGRPGFDPSIHFSIHSDPLPAPGAKTRKSKKGATVADKERGCASDANRIIKARG